LGHNRHEAELRFGPVIVKEERADWTIAARSGSTLSDRLGTRRRAAVPIGATSESRDTRQEVKRAGSLDGRVADGAFFHAISGERRAEWPHAGVLPTAI
jgi:hypothetical protein